VRARPVSGATGATRRGPTDAVLPLGRRARERAGGGWAAVAGGIRAAHPAAEEDQDAGDVHGPPGHPHEDATELLVDRGGEPPTYADERQGAEWVGRMQVERVGAGRGEGEEDAQQAAGHRAPAR